MKVEIGPYVDGDSDRTVDIHIDKWDTWNLDHTLALLIHPLLVKLKEDNHGYFYVDCEDVPEEMQSPEDISKYDVGEELGLQRYEYVMDEMIFAFDKIANFEVGFLLDEESKKTYDRVQRGTKLFGKYFQALWD